MTEEIRQIIRDHARLAVGRRHRLRRRRPLPGRHDLPRERQRDARARGRVRRRVPRPMLKRSVFESVAAIAAALAELQASAGGMSVDRRPRPGVPGARSGASPTRSRRPTPTTSTGTPASPSRRSTRCARSAPCRRFVPDRARRRRRLASRRSPRACFELGRRCGASAMVFAMHQIQVATIVRHLDGAPWFEAYLREVVAEPAAGRLGHLRGRHRRGHGPLDRRRHARRRRPLHVREAGADRQLRRATPTTCSRRCAARPTPSPATRSSC